MFLCGANDLITIFVAPECFSLCSYLLSGYTKKDIRSNEATTKYLLMGGASSSILVYGFSWLYGSSGGEIELQEIVNGLINTQMYNSPGILIALIFITVGIGFKLSPAPSHQWTPDVYEGVRCYIVGSHPSETTSIVIKKERREIGPCFPREAAFSQASSLLLLVNCSMTGFPVSWALLARLRSDPASKNLKTMFPSPLRSRTTYLACIKISNLSSKRQSIRIKKKNGNSESSKI
ncbi:hypothetical protein VNO77_46319 [Canavalia gladiata]|uniref:MSP domain-containing protein n=1 Tax=Canavalia gladiata TaxID=3824 RepID=A0AAN9JH19_CANGL